MISTGRLPARYGSADHQLSSNVHGLKAGGQIVHPGKGRDILAENQDETGPMFNATSA